MRVGLASGKQTLTETARTGGNEGHDAVPGKRTLAETVAPASHTPASAQNASGETAGGAHPHGGITGDTGAIVGGIIGGLGGAVVGGIAGGVPGAISGGIGGAAVGAAVGHALTAPRLTKSTVSGPTAQNNGGFSWGARWSIANASASTNGWIVQHVVVQQNVKDSSGNPIVPGTGTYGGLQTAWYPLWEAWQVRGGQVFVGGSASPHNADTYGQDPVGPNTKGSTVVTGRADFYPDLTLPSGLP